MSGPKLWLRQLPTLISLEIRQVIGGRRLIVIGAALLALCAFAALARLRMEAILPPHIPKVAAWPFLFTTLMGFMFLQTVVLLIPLLFATSLIRNEMDSGTLVYLVTRPIPRWLLLLAKFFAVSAVSAILVIVAMVLFKLAFFLPGGDPIPGSFDWNESMLAFMRAGVLGVIGYGALFTLVGLLSRRGLIWGIAYGFLSEFVLATFVPAVVKKLTLMHYLRSVALADLDLLGQLEEPTLQQAEFVQNMTNVLELVPPSRAYLTVFGVAVVCLALAVFVVRNLEFARSGPQQETEG